MKRNRMGWPHRGAAIFANAKVRQLDRAAARAAAPYQAGETEMANIGVVKWFNATKGFGFIQPDDGQKDVFVHISAVERAGLDTLREGQRISYEIVTERGRSAAANLKEVA